MDFIDELKWRGMIHDIMPGTEEQLKKEITSAYIGIDPTAESLHIGHLASIMLLKFFQLSGHKPIVLIGGATGMVGDPSGKSEERNLLDEKTLRHNENCIKNQLSKYLDFDDKTENHAEIVNNYDWMKDYGFLQFIRDIGKHLTVNYMLTKDSVKKRMESGISFTEFSYQLVQGYDFYYLYKNKNCRLQMGGSDQWGNITTGSELIRRITGGNAYALTCPLITKADGGKFGKTEEGNIWLDPKYTSPYKFYQFWLNISDEDAEKYIKIFTLLEKDEIENYITRHKESPHMRILQKTIAKEITVMVHSADDYNIAQSASEKLFLGEVSQLGDAINEENFLDLFEGVPQFEISGTKLKEGLNVIDLLSVETSIFSSKGEARRFLAGGGLTINDEKFIDPFSVVNEKYLLKSKYIIIGKGKKNKCLIICR
jgi:tyrosyl-tRNA synthetase